MSVGGDDLERERRLRALRLERREQQEELEGVVREVDAAQRRLVDVLRGVGERGDRCLVEAGPHRITGAVTHVGDEVVRLDGSDGRSWDVALRHLAVVAVQERGRHVRRVGRGHPRTLLARGRELAGGGAMVEVGLIHRSEPVRGRIGDVSTEVFELDRGSAGPVTVAWTAVAWLSEEVEPLRRRPRPDRSGARPA